MKAVTRMDEFERYKATAYSGGGAPHLERGHSFPGLTGSEIEDENEEVSFFVYYLIQF